MATLTVVEDGPVLVPVSEYGEFGALMGLCGHIAKSLGYHPVFVFTSGYGMATEHARQVECAGWSWIQMGSGRYSLHTLLDKDTKHGYMPIPGRIMRRIRYHHKKEKKWFGRLIATYEYLTLVSKFLIETKSLYALRYAPRKDYYNAMIGLTIARVIIKKLRPRLIISGQDFPLSVTSIFSKVAEENGIKTAIVPFSMPATTREIIESVSYFEQNLLKGQARKVSQKLVPSWLNYRRGEIYSRSSLRVAIAAKFLGLEPPVPWLPNSGRGVLFVPSQWAYDYYLKAGIPASHLRLTGAAWGDKLVDARSTRERRRSDLEHALLQLMPRRLQKQARKMRESGKPWKLMIVSWPTNQYPRTAVGCESYDELCRQMVVALHAIQSTLPVGIGVSLHPTLSDIKIPTMLQKAGIPILRGSLLNYVDCADIFVSPVSSTAFWALQSGVPTINLDCYLYGYTEFDEAGAITVSAPHELIDVSTRLTNDAAFYSEIEQKIEQMAERFGLRDGSSMGRILSELKSMAVEAHHEAGKKNIFSRWRQRRITTLDINQL